MFCVWFFGLGGFGIHLPYFSLYLRENAGLSGTEVGFILALLPLIGVVCQPLWGQLADRTGSRTRLLVLISSGAALTYLFLGAARSFTSIALGTAAFALFMTSLVPSSVAVSLALSKNADASSFGRIRVGGTIGFGVLVVAFPLLLEAWQQQRGLIATPGGASEPGLELMFPIGAAAFAISALVALALPNTGAVAVRADRGDWRELLRHGPFLRMVSLYLLAYVCVQGPLTMFPNLVRSHGGDIGSVSQMWILMLLLEVPLVAWSGVSVRRIGPRGIIAVGLSAGGLRWLICGLPGELHLVYAASLLHGIVVAGLMIGAPLYVEAVVPERLRSTAQSVLAMLGSGVGGMLSNVGTGWLFEHVGPRAPYLVGGIGALLLAAGIRWIIPSPTPTPTTTRAPTPRHDV